MPNYIEGQAISLRRNGLISYVIKGHGGRLFLRITGFTGSGDWSQPDPIYFDDLHGCINTALQRRRENDPDEEPYFTREELGPGIEENGRNRSAPLSGFVAAILMDIGFAECTNPTNEDGSPRRSDYRFRFRQGET